jgi:hypothetical protein
VATETLDLAIGARFPFGTGLTHRVLGRIAQAGGALPEALDRFARAMAIFASIEAEHEVGRTELALAELAHAQGDPDAVQTHVAQADALFARLGLPRYVERTRRLAASWGALRS